MTEQTEAAPHWLELIYREFLLRDIIGKVVPGAVVILSLFAVATSDESLLTLLGKAVELPWWIGVLGAGTAWLVGFCVQSIGEVFRLVRYWPDPAKHVNEADHFTAVYSELKSVWDNGTPADRRHLERLALIKEACGNGGVSLLLSGVLIALGELPHVATKRMFVATALVVGGGFLLRMHRRHIWRQYWFTKLVLKSLKRAED